MKIRDYPTRTTRSGVEMPQLPLVRKEDPRSFLVAAAMASAAIAACDRSHPDMEATCRSLEAILSEVPDMQVDQDGPDLDTMQSSASVRRLADAIGAWTEQVWFAKQAEFCDTFVTGLHTPAYYVADCIDQMTKHLPSFGVVNSATMENALSDAAMEGKSSRDVMTDPTIVAALEAAGQPRKDAEASAAGTSIKDLVEAFEASRSPAPTFG